MVVAAAEGDTVVKSVIASFISFSHSFSRFDTTGRLTLSLSLATLIHFGSHYTIGSSLLYTLYIK